jgi:hypothetical protein
MWWFLSFFSPIPKTPRKFEHLYISVNIARKIKCYVSKSKLILCEYNGFYFREIALIYIYIYIYTTRMPFNLIRMISACHRFKSAQRPIYRQWQLCPKLTTSNCGQLFRPQLLGLVTFWGTIVIAYRPLRWFKSVTCRDHAY